MPSKCAATAELLIFFVPIKIHSMCTLVRHGTQLVRLSSAEVMVLISCSTLLYHTETVKSKKNKKTVVSRLMVIQDLQYIMELTAFVFRSSGC